MKSKITFFILLLGMTVTAHALNLDATCIDDNVEVSGSNQKTVYLESGNEVKITEINGKNVTINFKKQTGTAEAIHFKIKYQTGLVLVSDVLKTRKYDGNIRAYSENDLLADPEVKMFLVNSFGINYADVLRNEVFARHGDSFKNKFYQDIFNKTSWYKLNPGFNALELNGFEQTNIKWLKSLSGLSNQRSSIPTESLAAYYPFNGNANDESGQQNNGINHGVTFIQDRFGKPQRAALFNGGDAYIRLTQKVGNALNDHDFTVSVWINAEELDGEDASILGCDEPATSGCLTLLVRDRKPLMAFYFNDTYGLTQLKEQVWYHLVYRYSKTSTEQAIYINGVLDNAEKGHGPLLNDGQIPAIGRWAGGRNFNGVIDDLRIYDRALNPDEIKALAEEQ